MWASGTKDRVRIETGKPSGVRNWFDPNREDNFFPIRSTGMGTVVAYAMGRISVFACLRHYIREAVRRVFFLILLSLVRSQPLLGMRSVAQW